MMFFERALSISGKIPMSRLAHNFHGHTKIEILHNGPNIFECALFAVNKPKDLGSTDAVNIIKNIIQPAIPPHDRVTFKVGHGGVLDRPASGVLAIGVGKGCKLLPKFLHGIKEYTVTGKLGISTTTYNASGDVTNEMPFGHVTKEDFIKALDKFCGRISQTPPVYSALKLQGRRYSDLAGEGVKVTPKPRMVKCLSLVCTSFDPPLFTLNVKCGGGFYIRSLINDLGIVVGSCAHVHELHRTQHGLFKENEAIARDQWTLEQIKWCIQETKKKHGHLFREQSEKYEREDPINKSKSTKHEKSIAFSDDLFDL
ncbi:pseudouridylate synthase TRUB1-like [Hetaerina americana]|uniref:pseudouridylate synthase TRUB1-like n=1 Tax=Hetaerina americana TaxID=62018 RepID=UPI003A7F5805